MTAFPSQLEHRNARQRVSALLLQQGSDGIGPLPSWAMRRMTVMALARSPRLLCSRSSRNSERRSGCTP